MKLLRRGECLLPPRRGNVNNRLRPEKVQSSCFRTGVRFPSAPLKKSRKYATFSFCFLSSLNSKKAPAPKRQSFFHIFSQLLFDLVDPEALRHINRHPDGPHRGTGRLDPCDQIINRVNCIRAGFHFGSPALFSLAMIRMGREFHLSDNTILEQICKNFDLDQITAREYIDSFGK